MKYHTVLCGCGHWQPLSWQGERDEAAIQRAEDWYKDNECHVCLVKKVRKEQGLDKGIANNQ